MTTRVVHVIPSLDQGGAEKQLTLLATHLPRDDWDLHVVTLTRSGPLAEPLAAAGVPLHHVGKSWRVDPAAYWRLRGVIRRLAPRIVHTWLFAANSYGRQAARGAGVPRLVAGERCVDLWKSWHQLAIDRYLARHTDRIVTNSSGVRDFYVAKGLPADKFVIIPNAVEVPRDDAPCEKSELLAELGLPPASRLVGAVGRLWPQKRIKDLIWAADLLKVLHDDLHLVILGDGPERARLERFQRKIEVTDRVHLLGHRPDAARLMRHFDVLWLGSSYEGQSNSVMEAMALGVPVVVTDIAGNRDLVVDGQSGLLFPPGDAAALARATRKLLEDRQLARQLGAAARRRMAERFSLAQMVARHAELYAEL